MPSPCCFCLNLGGTHPYTWGHGWVSAETHSGEGGRVFRKRKLRPELGFQTLDGGYGYGEGEGERGKGEEGSAGWGAAWEEMVCT